VTARWGCDGQASKSAPASEKKGAALHLQAAPDFGCGGPQPTIATSFSIPTALYVVAA